MHEVGGAGVDLFDELEEVGIIGVIGEREDGVGAVAVTGGFLQGPSADHGEAVRGNVGRDLFANGGGHDHDLSVQVVKVEGTGLGHGDAVLRIDLVEGADGAVRHDGQLRGFENFQDFLCFAEGIGEEDRDLTVVESFAAKAHDARLDGFGGREDKLGSPEGGFHHKGIGVRDFDGLGGEPRSGLEIAGIEEGFAGWGFDAHHRGTEDMTGGIKLNREGAVLVGFAVVERNAASRHRVTEADADKVDGGRGRKKGLMAGGVVTVRVGHDRKGLGAPRVHPKPAIGQIEPAAFNRSQHS